MKATSSKIVAALWLAGAMVGLLAIMALPGRWQSPALAHDALGVEIIDTADLCADAEHDLFMDGTADCLDGNGDGITDDLTGDGDAMPSHYLNFDSDGDGDLDTILVKLAGATETIRVVVHVHDSAGDDADGTLVAFETSGGKDVITAFSNEGGGGLDFDDDGDATGGTDGELRAVTATDTVVAHTVSDFDNTDAGECNNADDTCINDEDADGPAVTENPDGIAIVEITCDEDTDFTLTATVDFGGGVERDDEVRIICAEKFDISIVGLDGPPPTGDPQTVIAQATGDGLTGVGKADPDLTLLIAVISADDTPVPGQNVDCEIDEADEDLADLEPAAENDGLTDVGPNARFDLTPVVASPGIFLLSLESDVDGAKGEVTITCWVDNDPSDNDLDTDEIFDTITVRIAGPVDTVTLDTVPAKVTGAVTLDLSAQVLDNTGEGVADRTNCQWAFIPTAFPAGFTAADERTEGGKVEATLFIGSPTLLSGSFLNVSLGCGAAGDKISHVITIEVNESGAPPPGEPGDVNKDGTINVFDALAILLDIVGETDLEFPENADVNGDGSANIFDALAILAIVAGL